MAEIPELAPIRHVASRHFIPEGGGVVVAGAFPTADQIAADMIRLGELMWLRNYRPNGHLFVTNEEISDAAVLNHTMLARAAGADEIQRLTERVGALERRLRAGGVEEDD